MRKLSARHFRWGATAVGGAFVIALLLSDFFAATNAGLATAIDTARLQLFLLNPRVCPHVVCPTPLSRVDIFLVDVPIKFLAAATIAAVVALLFMASQRESRDSS